MLKYKNEIKQKKWKIKSIKVVRLKIVVNIKKDSILDRWKEIENWRRMIMKNYIK